MHWIKYPSWFLHMNYNGVYALNRDTWPGSQKSGPRNVRCMKQSTEEWPQKCKMYEAGSLKNGKVNVKIGHNPHASNYMSV
uniref:Uncharacterized protein n=1 Tax=Rhizophora mucronata TaxID=61149 RepID=A0A2P2J0F4_RHIMU